jgi:hypothetical protein
VGVGGCWWSTEKAELLSGLDVAGHDDVVGDVEPIDGGLPVEEQVEVARIAQGQHHHPVLGYSSRLLPPFVCYFGYF